MNKQKLFVASCISLLTGSMFFAIRGDIEGDMIRAFGLNHAQMGLLWSPVFIAFALAIWVSGAVIDFVGLKFVHVLSALGYIASVALILLAPHSTAPVDSIFHATGPIMLYLGFLIMGIAQGLVEGVINPLVTTVYNDNRVRKLNLLHAWWPGGMVIGGAAAVLMTHLGMSWQAKLLMVLIPIVIYLVMVLTQTYPKTERVASSVSTGTMWGQAFRPLFILIFLCMWMTASTELGPGQWMASIMTDIVPQLKEGIWFLVYTAGLMFVLRQFFSGFVHRAFSPFAVLTLGSVVAFIGLYWLGSLHGGTSSVAAAFAAATIFTLGVAFFWPTMLGVTADLFPKGGALLISLVGGAGMFAVALVLQPMGHAIDAAGGGNAGAALKLVARLPVVLAVIFGLIYIGMRAKGGYKAKGISEH